MLLREFVDWRYFSYVVRLMVSGFTFYLRDVKTTTKVVSQKRKSVRDSADWYHG